MSQRHPSVNQHSQPWRPLYTENQQTKATAHLETWLDALDNSTATIEDIASAHSLSVPTVAHAASCAYLDEGLSQQAADVVRPHATPRNHPALTSQLIRCLLFDGVEHKDEIHKLLHQWQTSIQRVGLQAPKTQSTAAGTGANPSILNLGFVCTYAHTSPALYGLRPMLAALDREHVRVILINPSNQPIPPAMRSCADRVIEPAVGDKESTTNELVGAIRQHNVHFLFDLNGHLRSDYPLELLLAKPAPIQISWWNSPISTGLPTVDAFFIDRFSIPPSEQEYFSETLFYLRSGATFAFELPPTHVSPSPCLQGHRFTYGSMHALLKLNPDVLKTWHSILQQAEHSRLYLKAQGTSSRRVYRRIRQAILYPNGATEPPLHAPALYLTNASPFEAMLECYDDIDLTLGTFQYNGATTTINSLWKGVPALSMVGNTAESRGVPAILKSCQLDDFITPDRNAYVRAALYWHRNPKRLNQVRLSMRDRLARSPFFSPRTLAQDLQAACQELWQRYRYEHPIAQQPQINRASSLRSASS